VGGVLIMDAPLRVMLVCDKLGYDDRHLHGEGRLMLEWTRALGRAGVEVTAVVLRQPGALGEQLRSEGLPFYYLRRRHFDPRALMDLVRLIRARGSQVVHLQGYGSITLGRIAARTCRIPAIVHIHTDHLTWGRSYRWWLRALDALLWRWTGRVLAVSAAAARAAVARQSFPPDRVRVLANPVDLQRFHPVDEPSRQALRHALGTTGDEPLVVCVARLFPMKGIERLIDAWSDVIARNPRARLLIVGEGPERAALEQRSAGRGLSSTVHFAGFRGDIERILPASDIMALPSRSDPAPLTLLEAMASGVPVVSFRVGGIPEVVREGTDGLLAAPDDIAGFASALTRLVLDRPLRIAMGASARQRAQEFGMDAFVQRLISEYRSLIGSSPERGSPMHEDGGLSP
jgi:glycosyltransferase involved in cell wall biosynthesis